MGFWDFVSGTTPAGVISDTSQKVVTGVFEGVGGLIDKFHLSPGDAQQFKLELARMELEAYRTQISDIQSARQMQMTNKSPWPGIITMVMLVGFFGVMGLIIFNELPPMNGPGGQAILLLIGALVTGFGTALNFWLGSSSGSQAKSQMLANSVPLDTIQAMKSTAQVTAQPTAQPTVTP